MLRVLISLMVISTALGFAAQAKPYQEKELKEKIMKLGLNKKITVVDFIKNAKTLNPKFKNQALEDYALENPDALMPMATISNKQSSTGTVPVITLSSEDGQDRMIQFLGSEKAAVKVGNIEFSESDLKNSEIIDRKLATQGRK